MLVPFRRPPVSASGSITSSALVLIDIDTIEGVTGRAYIFGFAQWTLGPIVGCLRALGKLIEGQRCVPLELDAMLRRQAKLLDTPGLLGFALSGIDMAAWDILAKASEMPLARFLGADAVPIPAYNSCGLWIQDIACLADEAQELVQEGGFHAVKLRLGRPQAQEDLAAVRAVRKSVGDRVEVMVDFNQCLSVTQAIARGKMLDGEGITWIEEPLRHADYEGYARVCAAVETPIQTGENLGSPFEMARAISMKSLDYVMPDLQRIGGVTGWQRAASLAQIHGIEMSSHLFPEYSCHLLAATPTRHWLEFVDWAAPILHEPCALVDGCVIVPERPGAGLQWDEAAVARYLVDV